MKCKKCGSENLEIRIVDIKNVKVESVLATIVLGLSTVLAIVSAILLIGNLSSNPELSDDFLEMLAGTLTDAVEIVVMWNVLKGSVVGLIVGSLYNQLLPYKTIAVKQATCRHCGNVQDVPQ